MSKHVCFDIGNVLYHIDFEPLITRLSKEFNVPSCDVMRFLNSNQKKCDLGITSMEEEVAHHFEIKSDVILKEVCQLWLDSIRPENELIGLVSELLNDGYTVALLSNIGHEHKARVNENQVFDRCIKFFSCDVGARKPTTLYYKTFLDLHPEFAEALYVDDLLENLAMGEKFGLKPIEFALDKLGKNTWLGAGKQGRIQLRMKLRFAETKTPDIEPNKETT